jgi:micrococcal nuclease
VRARAIHSILVTLPLTLLLLAACGGGSSPASAAPGAATLVRVIDGDTIVAKVGGREEHVRLIGIDTPETKDPRRPVECFGKEASEHMVSLLPRGTPLRLVRDVETRDRFGRLLAYVYRQPDGLFVNLHMVKAGYAAVLTVPPNVAHVDEFVAAGAAAREAGLGLWGACGGPDTPVASGG